MMRMPYDGVLHLAENLIVLARKAQQQQRVEIPRLMPALQHRMQQKEELMKTQADANAWLPEAREAKLSPMDYMDRCNKFLAKLDTLGWKRSFHQSLFHAVSGSCCAPVRTPVRTPWRREAWRLARSWRRPAPWQADHTTTAAREWCS
jgi:hypothetical protein